MIKLLIYGGIAFIAYTVWKNSSAGSVKLPASAPPKNGALQPMNTAAQLQQWTGVVDGKLAFAEGANAKISMSLQNDALNKFHSLFG